MSNINQKALILAKVETTYGTDATPSATVNAFVTTVPKVKVLGSTKERSVAMASFGSLPGINVPEGVEISFDVDLKASGTQGTAPAIGTLLRACNMSETITAGQYVDYKTLSTHDGESITIYYYQDGILHKIPGCRGTFKGSFKPNEPAMLSFTFQGLYISANITDTVFPSSITYNAEAVERLLFKSAAFTFQSTGTLALKSLEVDLGNVISKRADANSATGISAYTISDRKVKGSFDIEVVPLGTFNPFTKYDASGTYIIGFVIGTKDGNKTAFNINRAMVEAPEFANEDTIKTYKIGFNGYADINNTLSDIQIRFS